MCTAASYFTLHFIESSRHVQIRGANICCDTVLKIEKKNTKFTRMVTVLFCNRTLVYAENVNISIRLNVYKIMIYYDFYLSPEL